MDGTGKPHIEIYKDTKNYCNYNTICIVTSCTVCDSKNLKAFAFAVQNVQGTA